MNCFVVCKIPLILLWLNLCAKTDACSTEVFSTLTEKAMKQCKRAGAAVWELCERVIFEGKTLIHKSSIISLLLVVFNPIFQGIP